MKGSGFIFLGFTLVILTTCDTPVSNPPTSPTAVQSSDDAAGDLVQGTPVAAKRETNAIPEAVFVNALSDVTHEILAIRLKVRKIENYKLDLSIEEVTGMGEVKFLASKITEIVAGPELTIVSSTKKSLRVDVFWPATDELVHIGSQVRCCAQVIEVKKGIESFAGDLICIDLDPIPE